MGVVVVGPQCTGKTSIILLLKKVSSIMRLVLYIHGKFSLEKCLAILLTYLILKNTQNIINTLNIINSVVPTL